MPSVILVSSSKLDMNGAPARQLGLALARLMRIQNTRLSVLFFAIPQIGTAFAASRIAGGALLIVSLYGLCAVINDVSDLPIDRTNRRDLPLVRQQITQRQAIGLVVMLALVALSLNTLLPQPEAFVYSALMLVIGLSYSLPPLRLSHHGLAGTLALAACYVGLPLYLGSQFAAIAASPHLWLVIGAAICMAGPPLLYKDFKDEIGDRRYGKRTPLVRYGPDTTKALTVAFCLAGWASLAVASPGHLAPWIGATCGAAVAMLTVAARSDRLRSRLLLLYLLTATGTVAMLFTS